MEFSGSKCLDDERIHSDQNSFCLCKLNSLIPRPNRFRHQSTVKIEFPIACVRPLAQE